MKKQRIIPPRLRIVASNGLLVHDAAIAGPVRENTRHEPTVHACKVLLKQAETGLICGLVFAPYGEVNGTYMTGAFKENPHLLRAVAENIFCYALRYEEHD